MLVKYTWIFISKILYNSHNNNSDDNNNNNDDIINTS